MRSNFPIFCFGALLSLWSVGCTPEPLIVDIEQAEPQTVIYSQVITDELSVVYVARSFSALVFDPGDELEEFDEGQLLAQNAEVIMTHNGVADTLEEITSGIYFSSNTTFVTGDTYSLQVDDAEIDGTVSSSTQMQPYVSIDGVSAERDDTGDFTIIEIDYTFTDPPGQQFYIASFFSQDPLENEFGFADDQSGVNFFQLLSDQEFEDDTPELTSLFFDGSGQLVVELDTVYMSLSVIDREYYDFLNQRQSSGGIIDALVGEPISYVTNVDGGLGFFHLSVPDYATIEIDD